MTHDQEIDSSSGMGHLSKQTRVKSLSFKYDGVLNNMITDLISDTPEFKEIKIRIKEEYIVTTKGLEEDEHQSSLQDVTSKPHPPV